MLREEELNVSPTSSQQNGGNKHSRKPTGEKDFSFIQQNRVPSPLNNNFLLSEEQSRCHIRQISEGFMTAAHNLMNQDEFKNGQPCTMVPHHYLIDNQEMIEEDVSKEEGDDDNLDNSRVSLFTSADKKVGGLQYQNQCIIENLDSQGNAPLITESNNDDFNYSESNYQFAASSSIGAIIQGFNGGSFIAANFNQQIPNFQPQSSKYKGVLTSGRESATPFNYDENSLMNLSYTPTSTNHNFLYKGSTVGAVQRMQNFQQQNLIVEVLDDQEQEEIKNEQDESMVYPTGGTLKPQDEWFHNEYSKKNNPLEMPLQMQDQLLFSRAKLTEEEMTQFIHSQSYQPQQQVETQQDVDDAEDEIQMIKKKLDFSRLSSMQTLNQQQLMNQFPTGSFLFQTYQSQLSGQGANDNTQHYSTFQGLDRENTIPFEDLLQDQKQDNITQKGRNTQNYQQYNSTQTIKKKDGVAQIDNSNMDRFSCETASQGGIYQEPGISPPSRTKSSLNSTRPPIIKSSQNQQQQNLQQIHMFPSKLTVNSNNQPIQLNCINIFQAPSGQLITDQHNNNQILQGNLQQQQQHHFLYQVPPGSRHTTSSNSYSNSLVEVQNINNNQHIQNIQHIQPQQQRNKIYCNPLSDTPGEPSSIIIDGGMNDTFHMNGAGQVTQGRKFIKMLNDNPLQHQQQLFNKFMATTMTYQNSESNLLLLDDHLHSGSMTDNSSDQHYPQQFSKHNQNIPHHKTARLKSKKRVKDNSLKPSQQQQQQRVGSSKLRKNTGNQVGNMNGLESKQQIILKQQQQQLQMQGFMSKTMIISKDKIQHVNSKANINNEQQVKQQKIIENIIQQNQIQKYKQTKVKKIKPVAQPQSQHPSIVNHVALNSGRSLPNSNLSSAQTSFLTATATNTQNSKKNVPQKTTTKKSATTEEVTKAQKLKKKNKSILRGATISSAQQQHHHHLTNQNTQRFLNLQDQTLTNNTIVLATKPQHSTNQPLTKCNTHRSVSRPKSGFKKDDQQSLHTTNTYHQLQQHPSVNDLILNQISQNNRDMQQPTLKLGKKKHSQQIFTSNIINAFENNHTTGGVTTKNNNNKENIKPIGTKGSIINKKSFQMVGQALNRPEQMIQSFENTIKMINPQEMLKEIYQQQQKMIRQTNLSQNQLFHTMQDDQSTKRIKTEENNYHQHQYRFAETEIDPYNMLTTTLDSQRIGLRNLNLNPQNTTSFHQPSQFQHHQSITTTPSSSEIYDNLYKAALNQTNNNTHHHQLQQQNTTMNLMQKMQSPYNSKTMKNKFSSIKNKQKGGNQGTNVHTYHGNGEAIAKQIEEKDECRRCDELIHILKNTRFMAR